jgi:pimeloyl-ACP methyl ester carboxylesterase
VESVIRVDVSDVAPPGCDELAFEVFRPAADPRATLVCFPGGGMTRGYFDLAAPGYSFAAYARERGFLVALADHPGTGQSGTPVDGWALTPRTVATIEALSTERILATLTPTPSCVIGVGHSAGASVLIHQQAARPVFDGLVLLGWTARGLLEYLDERDRSLAEISRSWATRR